MTACVAGGELASGVRHLLSQLVILPRRLTIAFAPETPREACELQRLRGVWGAALHALDLEAYGSIFHPPASRPPSYILRMADQAAQHEVAFDFFLVGAGVDYNEPALRAWDIASGMGLGKSRHPFVVRSRPALDAAGHPSQSRGGWPLSGATWPLAGPPATAACRITFQTPVALYQDRKVIQRPTLKQLVAKACRRVESFLAAEAADQWRQLKGDLIQAADEVTAAPRFGQPLGVARYSGSQRRDFPIACVPGGLDLPHGPGPLWPLLAALQWLHVGKGTNIGLGQVVVEPLPNSQENSRFVDEVSLDHDPWRTGE